MALTQYGVNHPLAVKVWARKLNVEALRQTWISRFLGEDSNSLIQVKTELEKDAGDRIRIGLRMQLSGTGVQGDGTLEGNEEALTTHFDDIFIDQLRHAVRSTGKMSQQRVPFSVREEARSGLTDWWSDRYDQSMANQLTGNTAEGSVLFTGLQAAVAPDANHIFACSALNVNKTAEVSLSATLTDILKLSDIDRAIVKAKTLDTPIRPIRVGGGEYYVLFIHPFQTFQLRNATGTTDWATVQQAAMQGGKINDNPIFTGALGMHNNVLIHEWTRLPNIITAGEVVAPDNGILDYRRAVFCGAQAGCIAKGGGGSPTQMSWVEELFDYENQLGVSAGCIFGIKKSIYNSEDFATIVMSSWAPAV